jgi:hypothetical protein
MNIDKSIYLLKSLNEVFRGNEHVRLSIRENPEKININKTLSALVYSNICIINTIKSIIDDLTDKRKYSDNECEVVNDLFKYFGGK